MADYSVNATALSAPSGEGSQPVPPVKPATPMDTGQTRVLGVVSDLLATGTHAYAKMEADDRKNAVIKQYIRDESTIADGIAQGTLSPDAADVRSRANFRKYAAAYGEYIGDFEKAAHALRGYTEIGTAEQQLKTQQDIRQRDISNASDAGYTFLPSMPKVAQDSQIAAWKSQVRAKSELDAMYKRNDEDRAQGRYDRDVADREAKQTSIRLINDIAGSSLTAFQDFATTLGQNVRNGTTTSQEALATLNTRFSNISASLQAAASINPELASPYRSLFDGIYQVGQKLLDPKANLDTLDSELKLIQTRMKLAAMQDPKIAGVVVANQMLPHNPGLALASAPEAVRALALLSSIDPNSAKLNTPQVIGNPDIEDATLKLLKDGISGVVKGKGTNQDLAIVQASNSVNNLLKQASGAIDQGATPNDLKKIADFFASPEYASFVTSGKIDKQAAAAAKKTFQLLYEPAIIKGVQTKLNEDLFTTKTVVDGKQVPMKIGNTVNVDFTGSGIVFTPKTVAGLSPAEKHMQRLAVGNLKSAQRAINQIIHIGAHMEGSTDYAGYWEKNKHIYLPSIYPNPDQLKPGAVIDGWKYIGGPYNDRASWEQVTKP